jgi:hypothetical protein
MRSRAWVIPLLLGLVRCGGASGTSPLDSGRTDAGQDAGPSGADGGSGNDGSAMMMDGGSIDGGGSVDAAVDAGMAPQPITAPTGTWTWVDFLDSYCDDASPTGIGVNTSTASTNLIVFFNGGGACWDYETCYVFNAAAHGPFGQAQFQQIVPLLEQAGIFTRTATTNAFRDWSYVFVPYCTGDVHAGDNVATYTQGGTTKMYYHKGHANFVAFLQRLLVTFPNPGKLVISGSSAGGFGAAANYDYARKAWPNVKAYLIDDSGPPLEPGSFSAQLVQAWVSAWHIDQTLAPLCGDACAGDFSLFIPKLSQRYANDRLALLESLQDQTIRTYYGLTAMAFETALLQMTTDRLDPTQNFKYFYIDGQTHTMLGDPNRYRSRTTVLTDWLRQEVSDDPAWASTKP